MIHPTGELGITNAVNNVAEESEVHVTPGINEGGVTFRTPKSWRIKLSEFLNQDLVTFKHDDNPCPVHHYRHLQLIPLGKEPMLCHAAEELKSNRAHS